LNQRKPVIHIGMPKTATKTFQRRLFSKHSEVAYLGFYFGAEKKVSRSTGFGPKIEAVMAQIAHQHISNPDYALCDRLIKEVLDEPDARHKVPVWSWEACSTDKLKSRKARATNLKRVFVDAKILMTLRSPLSLLEASYFQQLRTKNTNPKRRFGNGPYYMGIDEWLDQYFRKTDLPHILYGDTIRAYMDAFGKESLNLFLFEELVADEEAFIRRVCQRMEIDADEGVRLSIGERDNERWTTAQIEILKRVKGSLWESLRYRMMSREGRMKLFNWDSNSENKEYGDRARAEISKEWQKRIFEVAREGNRWVEDEFGVPLTKYGYFGRD